MHSTPRRLLIGCEGKTEALYLFIIKKVYNAYFLDVHGEFGELFSLVDNLCVERSKLAEELSVEESEIEVWAVCDDDDRDVSYSDLLKYCEDRDINLAYSRPQFESYLLQHFSPDKTNKQSEIIKAMDKLSIDRGYDSYDKGDLEWLEEEIMDSPNLLDVAINNSGIRNKRTQSPFITFHKLVVRIRNIAKTMTNY